MGCETSPLDNMREEEHLDTYYPSGPTLKKSCKFLRYPRS